MNDSNSLRASGNVTLMLGVPTVASNGQTTSYTGVLTNQTSVAFPKSDLYSTFQAVVSGTGAITATVNIYGSNDGVNFCATAIGTITLSGTTSVTDGFTSAAPWKYVEAVLTNLTGTGAACFVLMGG